MNFNPNEIYVLDIDGVMVISRIIMPPSEECVTLEEPLRAVAISAADGRQGMRFVPYLPSKGLVYVSRDKIGVAALANEEFAAAYSQINSGLILPVALDVNSQTARSLIRDGGNGGRL